MDIMKNTVLRLLIAVAVSLTPALTGAAGKGPPLCVGCHGPTGAGIDPSIPMIAGQSPIFITYALKAFAAIIAAWGATGYRFSLPFDEKSTGQATKPPRNRG